MMRYYGLYSNAHRGMERKHGKATSVLPILSPPPPGRASPGWRELIRKVSETDPLICPNCGAEMRVIAFITNYEVIDKIIHHLGITFRSTRPPPPTRQEQLYGLSALMHTPKLVTGISLSLYGSLTTAP